MLFYNTLCVGCEKDKWLMKVWLAHKHSLQMTYIEIYYMFWYGRSRSFNIIVEVIIIETKHETLKTQCFLKNALQQA